MKPFLTVVNLVLITMGAYAGVQLFYSLALSQVHVLSIESGSIQNQKATSQKPKVVRPLNAYRHIAERNLFGLTSKNKEQPKLDLSADVATIEPTHLDLRLWGTVSSDGKQAYAVIESKIPGQRYLQQKLYQEGDTVLSARIEEIYRDKIVLSVDGDRQVLALEKYKGAQAGRRRAQRPSSKKPVRYSKTIQHDVIETAFNNLNTVMKQAVIRPHRKGMYISRIRNKSIFQKLGLRNGDVIVGVNGERLTTVDDALGLYYSLKNGSKVVLDIERRNRPVKITYAIN